MDDYTTRQVNGLLRGYDTLQHRKHVYGRGLDTLCELVDLERVMELLPDSEYNVVVTHGLDRLSYRESEEVLGEDHETLRRWYEASVKRLVDLLNGHG
jgi:DNA-directed RNA polymerase specialized sigma24 family protein